MAVGEWDERQLCPDGSCVGLIGDNGHCRVCNRVATNWGNERDRGLRANSATDTPVVADDELGPDEEWDDEEGDEHGDEAEDKEGDDEEEDEEAAKLAELDPSTPSLIGAPAEWSKRILCSDGACIGVIGIDGRCKVCGKPAKSKTLASATGASADIDHDSGSLENRAADDDVDDDDDDEDDDEGEDEDDEDGDDEDDDEDEDSADDDKRSAAAAGERSATTAADAELLAAATDLAATLPSEADFDRKLCPDGACVGVIGDNGRCGICGKEAA